jgi:hypothetical protein
LIRARAMEAHRVFAISGQSAASCVAIAADVDAGGRVAGPIGPARPPGAASAFRRACTACCAPEVEEPRARARASGRHWRRRHTSILPSVELDVRDHFTISERF